MANEPKRRRGARRLLPAGACTDRTGYCTAPDRDEPRLFCGYPLPCPYHSVVVVLRVMLGSKEDAEEVARVIKRTLRDRDIAATVELTRLFRRED